MIEPVQTLHLFSIFLQSCHITKLFDRKICDFAMLPDSSLALWLLSLDEVVRSSRQVLGELAHLMFVVMHFSK